MAASDQITGHGATVAFTNGIAAWAGVFTAAGDMSGTSRNDIDVSHLLTTDWMQKRAGDLTDPGDVSFSFLFDFTLMDALMLTLVDKPTDYTAATTTITYPFPPGVSTTAPKVDLVAWPKAFAGGNATTDAVVEGTLTMGISGAPVWTDAA